MRVLVSDCLRGIACRFDGGSKPSRSVRRLCEKVEVVGVCPEVAAGLGVPRPPAEQVGDRVRLADGSDVTEDFRRGARLSLDRARSRGASKIGRASCRERV